MRAAGVLSAVVLTGLGAAAATPRDPRLPLAHDGTVTVFVAGDSLASAYAEEEQPRAGWGQALSLFVGGDVRVVDEAWPGESTRTFLEEGRLDRIVAAVEPGDLVVVSFGHNDQMPDRRHTDPATTYRDHLRTFVERTRDAGGTPVLVTPVERRRFDDAGHAVTTLGDYPAAMREVADATGTDLVDLHRLTLARWERLGPAGTRAEFLWLDPGVAPVYPDGVHDATHLQAAGAVAVARLVARELQGEALLDPGSVTGLHEVRRASELVWPSVRPAQ